MRLKTHEMIEFLTEILIEDVGRIDDPGTFHEFVDGWSHFRDRVEAAKEELLDILWMLFILSIDERLVEDFIEALFGASV